MDYKNIMLVLAFLPAVSAFFNFNGMCPHVTSQTLSMQYADRPAYIYAKEYYDFYQKYKAPMILQQAQQVNYSEFAEKHKDNYEIFENNYQLIQMASDDLHIRNSTFSIDINEYADTIDFNSDKPFDLNTNLAQCDKPFSKFSIIPFAKIIKRPLKNLRYFMKHKRFSWNDTRYLSPVKNQGQCGSCWAFSTTTTVETFMRINNFTVERLSEQQLVDCSKEDYGCNGGLMHTAIQYIINNKGLLESRDYPYKAVTRNCSSSNISASNVLGSNLTDYEYIIPRSIVDMKKSLLQSPVAIAIDANNLYFRFYKNGVIDVPSNISRALNHAVTLVGFDYDDVGLYWIIQNSWGTGWGDNGFCKIRARPGDGVLMCQLYGVYPSP